MAMWCVYPCVMVVYGCYLQSCIMVEYGCYL